MFIKIKMNRLNSSKLTKLSVFLAMIIIAQLVLISNASAATKIKDLSIYLGTDYSTAKAINNKGQIVGTYKGGSYGYLLDNDGKVTDLGASVYPNDINDNGQIVGSYSIMGINHAFLWENGTLKDLGILGGTDYVQCHGSEAYKINNKGQIVGSATATDDKWHAFLWENGVMKDLGLGLACSINEKGQVVGEDSKDNNNHAFLWEDNIVKCLYESPYRDSAALDINENGQIVGWAGDNSNFPRAYLFKEYGDLGALGGNRAYAMAINDCGKIAGYSELAWSSFADFRACLWGDGWIIDLGTLGGKNSKAYDINNNGQIVGTAQVADGSYHPVIWEDSDTPTPPAQANYGDLNDDGKVNSADASILKRVILGTYTGTYDEINADMNNDKKINSADYSLLKRKILEIS